MPRRPRVTLPGLPLHLIQRGNNRQPCFFADEDYGYYLDWLKEYAQLSGCAIHAYVLMPNHVHLLLTPQGADGAGNLMKRLGQRYVQHVNRSHGRSGTLWEGRFRSCLMQEEKYVLGCYRYIELNPVRAGIVEQASEYRWSSHRSNAQGDNDLGLTPHRHYKALGGKPKARRQAYRKLFRHSLDPGLVDEIRMATNGNYVLGSAKLQRRVAAALGRRVSRGSPGRPRHRSESRSPRSGH